MQRTVRATRTAERVGQALYLGRAGRAGEHRMLLVALILVLIVHGSLSLAGSYQRTYDAYVHIFFADHYARWWFGSWDPRWYTGFSTVSYPPGSHQAIALLSHLVGLRTAFVAVQTFALLNCTIGVYRWSRLWVSQQAAGWAAIAFVLSSAIAETVHVFGQLPTTFSLGFLLNSLPFAYRWATTGSRKCLLVGIVTAAATTAGHHVTTLFGSVFFLGPVLVLALVDRLRTPLPGEVDGGSAALDRQTLWPAVARRLRRIAAPAIRACVYGGLVGVSLATVVLPYWLWSSSDPILQVSIPHASRDNFLENRAAGLVFWLVPWGTTLLVLPYAVVRGLAGRTWPLTLSLCLLTFLGTGGTTPYPRMLLGGAFDILTLDRFTFWATITILPLVGMFVDSMMSGSLRQTLLQQLGRRASTVLGAFLVVSHLGFTLFCMNLTHYRAFQPPTIDIKPILAFLDKDDHDKWRYIPLGFGDQMAWLSANTLATTVDGNYHSARRLPELTTRPIERLEGAKYGGVPGVGSLQQFLAVPERYALKYAFVNDHFYDPLLNFYGWVDLGPLENGINVWERADVAPLVDKKDYQVPWWQRAMWGTFPPGALASCLLLLTWSAAGQPLPRPMSTVVRRMWRVGATSPPGRAAKAVDRALERAAARVVTQTRVRADHGHQVREFVGRFRRRSLRMINTRRRHLQGLVVLVVLTSIVVGGAVKVFHRPTPLPQETVFGYFDDLDFRRFPEAYARLDPRNRPDYTQFRLDLARDGGLVASFAKLNEIRTRVLLSSADRMVVETRLVYLSALSHYTTTVRVELRRRGASWYIVLPESDPTEPPDQFTSRAGVRYIAAGRRRVTSGSTRATDVLDRPQLALSDVRSLRVEGRWVVIGEVTNVDVDPADVTVTGQLRGADQSLLAYWNADQVINHQLLPGESSPFRIDFQTIAGVSVTTAEGKGGSLHVVEENPDAGAALSKSTPILVGPEVPRNGPIEFDPTSITPLALPAGQRVHHVAVSARAVVTSRNLTRGLQLLDTRIERGEDGTVRLVGRLRNDSPSEVAVPHLLLAYRDAQGKLAWLDHAYLPHSLSQQRETEFSVPVSTAEGILPSGVPTDAFSGPVHRPPSETAPPMVSLPAETGFASVSVIASGYVRGAGS